MSKTQVPGRRRRSAWAALLCVSTLAACSAGLPRQADVSVPDLPATWSAAQAAETGSNQSRRTTVPLGDTLLAALIAEAIAGSPSVDMARASLAQARALRGSAMAEAGPNVGGSASAQRSRSGDAGSSNQFRLGLDASWELDLFGARRAALAGRDADLESARTTLADTQVSLAAEVALAYIQLRSTQQRLAIAQANLDSQRETLQITDWRTQAGLASSLELEQSRAASLQTEAQLLALRKILDQTLHALSVLTGRPPAALQARVSGPAAVPEPRTDLAVPIPADTLRQRPDVRAAEWALRAAVARLMQADAQQYPSFRLGGSIGLNALTLGGLANGSALVGALLGSIDIPVFDGGAARANVQAQEASVQRAQAEYRATVLTALKDVEDALVALRSDTERLRTLSAAAESAERAALLARQRQVSGLVDFQTVLETQRNLLTTQDSVATLRAELAADHVRLYKALGGGWTDPS